MFVSETIGSPTGNGYTYGVTDIRAAHAVFSIRTLRLPMYVGRYSCIVVYLYVKTYTYEFSRIVNPINMTMPNLTTILSPY